MSWTKVTSKRSGFRWDVFPFGGMNFRVNETGVTSFYVSEFPDYVNAKRLFEIFGCSGNVAEVAISPRRNNVGKRYAFARFRDVEDGRILAIHLDNILIEGRKLHVNLPRYDRAKNGVFGSHLKRPKGHVISNAGSADRFANIHAAEKTGRKCSYAAVLSKGQSSEDCMARNKVLEFQSDKGLKSRLEKAFVGRVCLPGSAYNIQNYLEMEGVFAIKATPLGGNCCLLEELEVGFIDDLVKEGESWWKSLFSTIDKWEAGSLDGSRDVWYRIYGVPLHAWCPDFFVALGESWGRFVCLDRNTSKGENLDVARIQVNIPLLLSIPESVTVIIDGVKHNLCVREDAHNFLRLSSDIKKVLSSAGDSSDASESDFERLMVDSISGCSADEEEQKVKGSSNSEVGGSVEEELALPTNLRAIPSGVVSEEAISGSLPATFVVNSGRFSSRLDGPEVKSDSGVNYFDENPVSPRRLDADVGVVNSLMVRSTPFHSGIDQLVLKGECNNVLFGERISTGDVPSESSLPSALAISSNGRDVHSGCKSAPLSGKGAYSGTVSEGVLKPTSLSGGYVRVTELADSGRGHVARSAFDRDSLHSGVGPDPPVGMEYGGSTSESISTNFGGSSRAGVSNKAGAAASFCSDSIETFSNCLVGAGGSNGAGVEVLSCSNKVTSLPNSNIFQPGGRCGRKLIRKVSLV